MFQCQICGTKHGHVCNYCKIPNQIAKLNNKQVVTVDNAGNENSSEEEFFVGTVSATDDETAW